MTKRINNNNNFVSLSMKNTLSLERVNNSFVLKKLKDIFFNWNIVFFKFINLRKNKINLLKLKLNKNSYLLNFNFMKSLNIYLFSNKILLENKINIEFITFNGYFLNNNFLKLNNYTNILFEKKYFFLFIYLFLGLWIKVLFFFYCKIIYHLRSNFLMLKIHKINV